MKLPQTWKLWRYLYRYARVTILYKSGTKIVLKVTKFNIEAGGETMSWTTYGSKGIMLIGMDEIAAVFRGKV